MDPGAGRSRRAPGPISKRRTSGRMESRPQRAGDEGFTFNETVIAALAFAAVGLVLYALSSTVVKSSSTALSLASGSVKAVLVDKAVREAVESVKPPYWACGFEVDLGDGSCSVPYFDGAADKAVEIDGDGSTLTIRTPAKAIAVSGVRLLSIGRIGEERRPLGLSLTYSAGGRDYETKACFSSFAMGGLDGQ